MAAEEGVGQADRCASSCISGRGFHVKCSGLPGSGSLVRFLFVIERKCTNEVTFLTTNIRLLCEVRILKKHARTFYVLAKIRCTVIT